MTMIKRNTAMDVAPRFFDSFLLKDLLMKDNFDSNVAGAATAGIPAVNISVNDEAFFVELVAPGLSKEFFKIALDKDELTISYQEESKSENSENNTQKQYLLREFGNARSFTRRFSFAKGAIDETNITATYTDGVLRLVLAKREEVKPKAPRQIEIA